MAQSPPSHHGAEPGGGRLAGGFSSPETHRALPQALYGEEDFGSTFLENLYCLVKKLSSILSLHDVYGGDAFSVDLSTCSPVIYGLLSHLSDRVFEELHTRFERMLRPGKVAPPAEAAGVQYCNVDQYVLSSSLQDFCVLLRCCIIMLHLVEFDFDLCKGKGQILVRIARELCSPDVMNLFVRRRVEKDGLIASIEAGWEYFSEESGPPIPFICLILEVFADELLVHQNLRKHFTMVYHVSSANEKLLAHDCVTCDVGIIMELLSAHFLLFSHEETAFRRLFHLKFCRKMMDTVSPKLSLTAALALLGTPAIFSAPYMLQSHTILLVSRCVAASGDLSLTAMNCYMSAFEQSVILYACYFPRLPLYHDHAGAKCQSKSFVTKGCVLGKDLGLAFDWYVQKYTYDAVNLQSQKLAEHCTKQSCNFLSRTKAETVTACVTCIKENQHVIQEQWRDETCLLLNCIIQRIAGETDEGPLCKREEVNWQDIYYGASLLNLMGSSLLQIVTVLNERGTKTLNDYILCRDYEFVSGVINFFGDHSPGPYVLCDMQAAYSSKLKQTKLMLAHFTNLLFYSIDKGLYPLWEGCIFVMIAVMNLLVFEEGNLDTARIIYGCVREISISQLPVPKISPELPLRRSSVRIASNFLKIQLLHAKEAKYLTYASSRMDAGANQTDSDISPVEMDKSNGEAFLKCVMEDHSVPDWDDLANFIEATPGKDYTRWLHKRESYNKWKNKKMAVGRHRRKRMLRRKITVRCIER